MAEGADTAQVAWIADYSNHGCLYMEVQKI
jgi:hypothetical protein